MSATAALAGGVARVLMALHVCECLRLALMIEPIKELSARVFVLERGRRRLETPWEVCFERN